MLPTVGYQYQCHAKGLRASGMSSCKTKRRASSQVKIKFLCYFLVVSQILFRCLFGQLLNITTGQHRAVADQEHFIDKEIYCQSDIDILYFDTLTSPNIQFISRAEGSKLVVNELIERAWILLCCNFTINNNRINFGCGNMIVAAFTCLRHQICNWHRVQLKCYQSHSIRNGHAVS